MSVVVHTVVHVGVKQQAKLYTRAHTRIKTGRNIQTTNREFTE